MKNKVYIVGPPSSGKTTFMHKMMGKDYAMFKDNIIEVTGIPDNIEDAIQVYLIFPDKEELASRGTVLTDEENDLYMEFYHTNAGKHNIVMVTDF